MYPISEAMKERFESGQRQIARLTVNNNPYEPYKEEYYFSHFNTNVVLKQKLKDPHFESSTSPKWRGNASLGTFAIANNKAVYTITSKSANQSIVQDSVSFTQGHVYLTSFWITTSENQVVGTYTGNTAVNLGTVTANTRTRIVGVFTSSVTSTRTHYIYPARSGGLAVGGTAILEDCCLYDLTEMFGAGKEYIGRSLFFDNFPNNYYPYDEEGQTVPFQWTIYGGSVDVETGVLSVTHSKYTFTGTEGWTVQSGQPLKYWSNAPDSGYLMRDAKLPTYNSQSVPIHTDIGDFNIAYNNLQNYPYSMCIASDSRIGIHATLYSGQGTLAGYSVIYELANPVTFQITPEEVRTFLGVNHISSDTGEVEVTYRNTSGEYVTVSGDTVTFPDGAKDVPVQSLSTAISYTQDLNGYDHPWVGGGGKNKLNYDVWKTVGIQRGTAVWENNGVTLTATGNDCYTNYGNMPELARIPVKEGDVVKLSWEESTNKSGDCYIFSGTGAPHVHSNNASSKSCQLTVGSGVTFVTFRMGVANAGDTISYKNIMVQVNSSATAYEPYSNICPIEGWDSATIYQTGKNMFNGDYINGDYDNNGHFRVRDEQYVAVYFAEPETEGNLIVEGGKDYTISFDTIGIRGKDFYTLEFDKETGEYIRGTKTLRFTQQAGKTIPRRITVRPYFDSILVWYWDAGYGYDDEYNEEEFNEITMVTLPSQIAEDVVIRESDIVEGSLSVNRYCTTGKSAMIGSCVASEMNVILNNENGKYNDVNFIGKDISVEVGTLDANDRPDFMPIGIFQVDDSPKKLEHISITALDRMMLLEKPLENLPYPTIVRYLYEDICSRTNVRRKTTELWNENYVIDAPPENLQTYRDALSCLCEITGTCAYFDWDGRLCLEWFSQDEPTIELTTANRIVSDLAEESVQITGVEVKAGEGTYLAGTDAYTLSVAQNPLVTHDAQALADALYGHLGWLAYRPFTATTLPMPYIYPMDMAAFVDKDGNESLVAITDWTFRLNRNTELRGRGESSQQASFKKKYGIGENGADIDEALGILRDTIIKNAEIINQQMETIERTLHGQYEALSSEFGSYRNETDAKITANAEGITQAYTNIEEIDSKYGVAITDTNQAILQVSDGAVATNTKFREVTEAYIKSGKLYYEGTTPVYGVAVGQLTYEMIDGEQLIKRSGVYSVFTSDELAFYIDDVKVAYMKNKKLYINEAEFVSAINVGRYKLEDGANGFTIKYGG